MKVFVVEKIKVKRWIVVRSDSVHANYDSFTKAVQEAQEVGDGAQVFGVVSGYNLLGEAYEGEE